ncbi:hypothetical protein B0O41_2346 [Propionibacteriaceae bacterium ES.041]|nr:hypothetical protein B0O41_2346 [Propionibacteriaceae bacterium ES.041]TDO93399.1 hypothetical protein C8D81_1182 [Enemella evansiae]
MTTVTGAVPPGPASSVGASHGGGVIAIQRARTLLFAGLLGAHAAALLAIGVSAVAMGKRGLFAALFGAALVIVFQVIGQAVQVRFAAADTRTVLAATLASFGFRVGLMLFVLYAWFNLASDPASLARVPLVVSAALTVTGWLAAEAYALHRLRVPYFDEPTQAPDSSDPSGGEAK